MNKRVDYIDVIKGIAIWGVIWRHTTYPDWLTLNFIFFILGGFFFKRKPIKVFLKEKIQYYNNPISVLLCSIISLSDNCALLGL